jgi:predicted nucleotidyltransferase
LPPSIRATWKSQKWFASVTSIMLTVPSERALDPMTVAVLRSVDSLLRELGIDYFVTGAMARDILLFGVHGIKAGRETRDIDLAVAIAAWAQFETIKSRLVTPGQFVSVPGNVQRLLFRARAQEKGYPLDIIPFGDIEHPPASIAWPPDRREVLNVAGYRDALASAVDIEIEPDLVVPVASLAALTILKLYAWQDRGRANPKDAFDLATVMQKYADAGNEARLYGQELALLEAVDYDLAAASPRLLGKDVSRIATAKTKNDLLAIFTDPNTADRFITNVSSAVRGMDDPVTAAVAIIGHFKTGLEEG